MTDWNAVAMSGGGGRGQAGRPRSAGMGRACSLGAARPAGPSSLGAALASRAGLPDKGKHGMGILAKQVQNPPIALGDEVDPPRPDA